MPLFPNLMSFFLQQLSVRNLLLIAAPGKESLLEHVTLTGKGEDGICCSAPATTYNSVMSKVLADATFGCIARFEKFLTALSKEFLLVAARNKEFLFIAALGQEFLLIAALSKDFFLISALGTEFRLIAARSKEFLLITALGQEFLLITALSKESLFIAARSKEFKGFLLVAALSKGFF